MNKGLTLTGVLLLLLVGSCGGGGSTLIEPPPPPQGGTEATVKILMMGNSHTGPIPSILSRIFSQLNPSLAVEIELAPGGMFLIDRMNHTATLDLLRNGEWTHVVLQALKYSTSGTIDYPTTGAEFFIDETNSLGGVPILFPEHPRRWNTWESSYLYNLHSGIATEHSACVSPIGFVWEDFMAKSSLSLHQADGNHATTAGSFLTALVIYQTIMEVDDFNALANISGIGISDQNQIKMRASVVDVMTTYQPCAFLVH